MRLIILSIALLLAVQSYSQTIEEKLHKLDKELEAIKEKEAALKAEVETLKLERIRRDLKAVGLPGEEYITHSAMMLAYSEEHEQAAWVAHIITPDIMGGTVFRTNDFRPDPKVATGTAVEEDYFLKFLQADSTYKYDGYGYDRGHLAPSADFRWSQKALSESYFYSNMSPQLPGFNRGRWAELESVLRRYIFNHPTTQLYVVTLPVLTPDLPKVERSKNGVSIPEQYVKVVIDLQAQQGIAFLMQNKKAEYPLETYAVSIDEIEALCGYDFFNKLDASTQEKLEANFDKSVWFPEVLGGDVEPIYAPSLPKKHFNTVQAKLYAGKGEEIRVCGTVVSTRFSRSGNLWFNIDKQFPNQIFSVFIKKEHLINFSYQPDKELIDKQICFKGEVEMLNGTPTMRIENENDISFYPQE